VEYSVRVESERGREGIVRETERREGRQTDHVVPDGKDRCKEFIRAALDPIPSGSHLINVFHSEIIFLTQ
jgi:hypothetical protein